jgi:glycerate 2-kinase
VKTRALACPASLKGVLAAWDAAAALAQGLRAGGAETDEAPMADGGEGTAEVLARALGGTWHETDVSDPLGRQVGARWLVLPDGTAVVEAAAALGLTLVAPEERDPLRASSRGLGELVQAALAAGPRSLIVALGGTATVDGGAGLREVVDRLPLPTRALYDVRVPLLGERGAARLFGPQKGASPEQVDELERRLAAMPTLRGVSALPGAGAAGGLGAALAALGAELVPGAAFVADAVALERRLRGAGLAVTGEGTVDAGSGEGKAPGAVAELCRAVGVRCAVFGGRIAEPLADVETYALSGRPERAAEDLRELGERLAGMLLVRR